MVYIFFSVYCILTRVSNLLDSIHETQDKLLYAQEEAESLAHDHKVRTQYGSADNSAVTLPPLEEPMPAWRFFIFNYAMWAAVLIAWMLISAAVFCALDEKETYLDAIYFSWITATTVGYGSTVTTTIGRTWSCTVILISLVLFAAATANASSMSARRQWRLRRHAVAAQGTNASILDINLLRKLEAYAGPGRDIDRITFLTAMLAHLELVPRTDIQLLLRYFDMLDKDKSGTISIRERTDEYRRVQAAQEP